MSITACLLHPNLGHEVQTKKVLVLATPCWSSTPERKKGRGSICYPSLQRSEKEVKGFLFRILSTLCMKNANCFTSLPHAISWKKLDTHDTWCTNFTDSNYLSENKMPSRWALKLKSVQRCTYMNVFEELRCSKRFQVTMIQTWASPAKGVKTLR